MNKDIYCDKTQCPLKCKRKTNPTISPESFKTEPGKECRHFIPKGKT